LLTNLKGPNKTWVPKLAWSNCRWLEMHWKLDNQQEDRIIDILSSIWTIMQILTQCNLKHKISAYPCTWIQLMSLYLVLLQIRNHIASYSKFISLCHMMLLMALLWTNVFYLNRYTSSLQMRKERQGSITHREIQVILAYQ
jgi:hypothetical protein